MWRFVRDNGLGLFFGGIFLVTLVGQALVGHADFNHQQFSHHGRSDLARPLRLLVELRQRRDGELAVGVPPVHALYLGTVWLLQRGSPESKPMGKAGAESDEEQKVGEHASADSPRWARVGGWRTASTRTPW